MPKLSSRVEHFTESVIRSMTKIADHYGAINLSQGFPDFDPPKLLLDELKTVCDKELHQYEITYGAEKFREALAAKQQKFMDLPINPEENIVVTCGSTEAMMAVMMAVCDPGEKVIIFSPFYENYSADTILSGCEPIFVPLIPPTFHFDKGVLRQAFKQNPKAIVICNPSNPTGKVFTKEELAYIATLCIEFDVFAIMDEVYEHIVFKGHKHTYMASLPDMFERTISCSSLSKTYSITGWRLGYVIAHPTIIEAVRKTHDFLTVGAPSPLQHAAIAGLKLGQQYYDELTDTYTRKKEIFLNGLTDLGFTFYEPQGTYFTLVDVSQFNVVNDFDFCKWLIKEVGVGAVPGSSFFREPIHQYIRLHFAKKEGTLLEALGRLKSIKTKKYMKNN
ncbi:MAG: aminotransferase [Bacillales bacterium]|nr:aminotransferase [Bacillales bacterium]